MPRYKVILEYNGGGYSGWQYQANRTTIQGEIERALEKFCGVMTTVTGAGRTDAGVHASHQVAHFDIPKEYELARVVLGLNFHLRPQPIVVISAEIARDDFHARFSATSRTYIYRIINRLARPAINAGLAWHVTCKLNVEAMQEAGNYLIGRHDFTSFRASNCQAKSPVRSIDMLKIWREGDDIFIKVHARSFLHSQVRIITGTLKEVGEGRRTPDQLPHILAARSRNASGVTAPAEGLCLVGVEYS